MDSDGASVKKRTLLMYCKLHCTCPGESKKLDVLCYERAVLVAPQPKKEVLCLGMCDVICNRCHPQWCKESSESHWAQWWTGMKLVP